MLHPQLMYMDTFISRLHLQIAGIALAYSARGCGHERGGARAAAGVPGPDGEVCRRPTHDTHVKPRQFSHLLSTFCSFFFVEALFCLYANRVLAELLINNFVQTLKVSLAESGLKLAKTDHCTR